MITPMDRRSFLRGALTVAASALAMSSKLGFAFGSESGRMVHVAPHGSDLAGTGTAGNPFATIQRAANFLMEHPSENVPTIQCAAGDYTYVEGTWPPHAETLYVKGDGPNSVRLRWQPKPQVFDFGTGIEFGAFPS